MNLLRYNIISGEDWRSWERHASDFSFVIFWVPIISVWLLPTLTCSYSVSCRAIKLYLRLAHFKYLVDLGLIPKWLHCLGYSLPTHNQLWSPHFPFEKIYFQDVSHQINVWIKACWQVLKILMTSFDDKLGVHHWQTTYCFSFFIIVSYSFCFIVNVVINLISSYFLCSQWVVCLSFLLVPYIFSFYIFCQTRLWPEIYLIN